MNVNGVQQYERTNANSKMMMKLSRCLGNDEDAHEKNHEEKDPHKKSIHHLGNLLPLCYLNTCCSLLTEAVGNVLDVLHHLQDGQRN